jgi:hypothetical protein
MGASVVLDTSAIRAFARGSVAVGEILMILGEEANRAALPAVAMAEAFDDLEHIAMNRYLLGHPRTEVIPLDVIDIEDVGLLSGLPSLGHAHAVVTARRLATFLLTGEPDSFVGFVDKEMIIEV